MSQEIKKKPKYPGKRITTNGNQLVSYYTEARLAEAGVFYPITPSTEMGENFQLSFANGELNVFGDSKIAIEAEGEHAAQSGAIAISITGKRVVNFTSGQGVVYGLEPYYHAPAKLSTMVVQIAARALTKSALNVHCGHDDVYTLLDTGWSMLFSKDAQQASDQALILRRVNELALNPGINVQDGFLTSHLERTFLLPDEGLIREFLGRPDDIIECPTDAQRELFGKTRRRVPECIDLKNPILMGPVQNQEHYMNGVIARRNNFVEPILGFFEKAYQDFGDLTGRYYGLISQYNCEKADTIFISLGSSAENIEAAVDYIKQTRNEEVGVIHINVIRPFPEKAIIEALRGRKNVIVLERMDDQTSGDNPLARDIRTALSKAHNNSDTNAFAHLPKLSCEELPRIFSGVYGLGSRDFRPEGVLGAYEFVTGKIARKDGKKASDGVSFVYIGVDHPYAVESDETPSLLPDQSIAIRFHSIGGWGAITTGKNLGEILGELSSYIAVRDDCKDEDGNYAEVNHISANPKYGSEKKGAPTSYFLVVAPERIRVNCDLRHVDVVLCCDPKAFTHTNPLAGLNEGGALIIESNETTSEGFWKRIPREHRQEILDKNIRLYGLEGFKIATDATDRGDLQFRMQGNSFLGAFFKVGRFLKDNNIPDDEFLKTVEAQYDKKFSRFGNDVVQSNMTVMKKGFEMVWEATPGKVDAPDTSSMRGETIMPVTGAGRFDLLTHQQKEQPQKAPMQTLEKYNSEFRAGYGYNQPSSALASTGIMAAATAATNSKYVSRRKVPKYFPENCTQCMDCIVSCPDTALPNTAQDISTVIETAVKHYVSDDTIKKDLLALIPEIDDTLRVEMLEIAQDKKNAPPAFVDIFEKHLELAVSKKPTIKDNRAYESSKKELRAILSIYPVSYAKVRPIFEIPEKKEKGTGGVFSIMISDLCKGCGECVLECGEHNALKMVLETEEINGENHTSIQFMDLMPETTQKYLGKFNADKPIESKAAVLQNHLMVRSYYDALVSGDGACAGCGEKTVLKAVSGLTEAYMRPLYHAKSERLNKKAVQLVENGLKNLESLKKKDPDSYLYWSRSVKHLILGLGSENDQASVKYMDENFKGSDKDLINALNLVLRQDAFNHRDLRAVDERYSNGMSVMMMTSSTGCNSVYGSTHPNNPHQYPWMNSLFQDSPTIGWLWSESIIIDHGKRSVIPERLTDFILNVDGDSYTAEDYFTYTHFSDAHMTDLEITELPKVWAVGGDGAIGDIGYQNLSKVVLQNRPNMKVLMLDTQVYSNTGGQNSDSSVMPGGFDMNQAGAATEGKLTERKEVAGTLLYGHGSPFVGQVSMANAANLFRTILDGLLYRGTAYIQAFSTCQPEHGVPDDKSTEQAKLIRDSRGMPEFVFNPSLGEDFRLSLSLKGNPNLKNDWMRKTIPGTKDKYNYTVAHWATTEARFRKHFFKIAKGEEKNLTHLDEILKRTTQNDITNRSFLNPKHRAYIPVKGVYILVEKGDLMKPVGISRHMALFAIERRKNWRVLQSLIGIENSDYQEQKAFLSELEN
ncbi:MAG: 2-oxoacid:acceptor oxidoreductase family protein [Deltaproteobacteria bacterium]|nr:2-oxoacid:acceptor oxidoreductase family protein [Deltaproteobacteria bacterium]